MDGWTGFWSVQIRLVAEERSTDGINGWLFGLLWTVAAEVME